MPEARLSRDQEWAGIFKREAVVRLLSHGAQTLGSAKYVQPVLDPVLTVWSIGVEKLLKLSLGHRELVHGRAWPSQKTMSQEYGHKIAVMDENLRDQLREWARTKSPYVGELVARVDADPIWPELRSALDLYGRAGRFHHLDVLAGRPTTDGDPRHAWQRTEQVASDQKDLSSWHERGLSNLTIAELDAYAMETHQLIVDSLVSWWFTITRSAMHGFLGEEGKRFGSSTGPDMAIPPLRPKTA